MHLDMTQRFGHVARLRGGVIGADALYITDPAALYSILVRDQNTFRESTEFIGLFGIMHRGNGVASVWGDEHKKQRKLIDPIFTAARIAKLTPLFYQVAYQLRSSLATEVPPAGCTIDILDHLTRTALELIAQGGLGHTFNSFDKNSQEFKEFQWAITSILPLASSLFLFLPYMDSMRKMRPVWLRRFLAGAVSYLPWTAVRQFKKAIELLHPVYDNILETKKLLFEHGGLDALEETVTGGKDLMTLLFKSNWDAKEDKMPDDVVTANMGSVVHGAQETTSSAMARLLSLMATHPNLQIRIRQELIDAKKANPNEDLDFYELNSLPLLDAVCKETLRLYTPVTFVWRQTMEDTIVPLQFPVRDNTGALIRELPIAKGTAVYLGLAAANRSNTIWGPDATEYKPERWLGKLGREGTTDNNTRLPGIYSNMMTFLGGGRACPGHRFAVFELKLVLSVLLLSFSFEKADPVEWKLGITLTPYVQGEDKTGPRTPKVPVKVTKL
ncbi:cytochrome P450 [Tricholoma matsutake]|nr:cytochrome P450 [Tricholoma matsutake 945]